MNLIDYYKMWKYKPESSIADTSSFNGGNCITSTVSTTTNSEDIADAIAHAVNKQIKEGIRIHGISGTFRSDEKEHKLNMNGINFNDLEKELKEFGIELSTIRHSSGEIGFEIEGYFMPDKYKIHRGREWCSVPITPKKPLPKKVIFSGLATTILWKDGTKTTVKCQDEDVWADDVGVAMCYLKKMLGNKGNFNNIFRQAMKVAEVQTKKEELTSSTVIEGESYYSSALDSMKQNIDEINDFMKDAADALNKALGGKK